MLKNEKYIGVNIEQNTDCAYTDPPNTALDETSKAMNNLIKAMEAEARMDELDIRKAELETALADSKLRVNLGIKNEHILYSLRKLTECDYEDTECQKRLIKAFINSVFVYDDKVVLMFNYSGDNRTITIMEIDAGLVTGVRLSRAVVHQNNSGGLRFFAVLLPFVQIYIQLWEEAEANLNFIGVYRDFIHVHWLIFHRPPDINSPRIRANRSRTSLTVTVLSRGCSFNLLI